MSKPEVRKTEFSMTFPVSQELELHGRKIVLSPPNFGTLGVLEDSFGVSWDEALSRIDIRDRDAFIDLFTILAQQNDPTLTKEEVLSLIDIQNMWDVVKALKLLIAASQPDPNVLAELMRPQDQTPQMEMDLGTEDDQA